MESITTNFKITLPLMRPIMTIALLIRMVDLFRVFDIVYVMTRGGPAFYTELTATYIYRVAFKFGRFGAACALSYITLAISIVFAVYLFGNLRRAEIQRGYK
ncbi:MAG TPA: sugar ABC transporter permease [Firmicutes bacterium]|nr:sugar ABC transporter permease [Bacillota bacterium]